MTDRYVVIETSTGAAGLAVWFMVRDTLTGLPVSWHHKRGAAERAAASRNRA